jgi:NAD(P)-dependent dehydrogenase (short-subunit alcohol dehydrogenase family)
VRETADQLGRVDILINNAAVQGPIGPAWEVPWHGRGWIINISGGGATGPRPIFTAYAAAKTALVRFTKILAIETAPHGVRVNAVAPGGFASGITKVVHSSAEGAGEAEASIAQKLLDKGDIANAEKAARLVVYLTIGDGRDVTGKLISAVWDRWDCLHRYPEVLARKEVFTLRRILPVERNLRLDK